MKISVNKKLLTLAILSMGLTALMGNKAFAISEFKLTASEGAAWDRFGCSVSISGDRAVIGAFGYNSGSGRAYVFRYDGSAWAEEAKLTASDAAAGDYFGYSVSLSGQRAVVGAHGDDTGSGSAYVFRYDGSAWVEEAKLTASDRAGLDYFGWSVSISGDRVVIGAFGDDASGSAYVFRYDGAAWVEEAKLTASDGAAGDAFGWSVSISGDRVVVGDSADDSGSGSAYVFRYDGISWVEETKLTASDRAELDHFGSSVSITGDRVVVGAQDDDDAGTDSGSAYVFRYDGAAWVEEAKLTASDAAAGDAFGYSVSTSGDRVVVGAEGDDDAGTDSGSAYVFRYDGNTWVEEFKLIAGDGAAEDYFGYSISISGDRVVVGAVGDDDAGDHSGSAYVFMYLGGPYIDKLKRRKCWPGEKIRIIGYGFGETQGNSVVHIRDRTFDSSSRKIKLWSDTKIRIKVPNYKCEWLQGRDYRRRMVWVTVDGVDSNKKSLKVMKPASCLSEFKLTASDGAAEDYFGWSVSTSGDRVVVGAYRADDGGTDSGSAYVFRYDGAAWVEEAKLTASDAAEGDYFSVSVSISGDRIVVGASHDDDGRTDSGSAYVFRYDGAAWVKEAKLTASDRAVGDYFGVSVSIGDKRVLVGAHGDDDAGTASGSAYVFRHDGSAWVEEAKLTASDGEAYDRFGWSLSIGDGRVLVGAFADDTTSGSAYVFRYDGSAWTEEAKLTASDSAEGDYFGYSVSISGGTVAVGAIYDDDAGTDSGSAYVFK